MAAAFNRALGVPDAEGVPNAAAPTAAQAGEADEAAEAAEAAAAASVAAVANAETAEVEGFDGAAAATAAAATTAAHHDELVMAMAAYIEEKSCTLSSIYMSFVGDQRVSPSEFSIWLRRPTVTPRIISARKAAQIDAMVAAFLQQAAAAAPAPAVAATAPLAAAAGAPAVLTRTLVRILVRT